MIVAKRITGKLVLGMLLVSLLTVSMVSVSQGPVVSGPMPTASSFSFGAGGDFGISDNSAGVFERLATSGSSFFLALGDMDYDMSWTDPLGRTYLGTNDADFCRFISDRLGATFPFELVSGNHEAQGGPDGYILNHAACLPDRLGSVLSPTQTYAAEYYFDYPSSAPLVRVVMIAAGLTVNSTLYEYVVGNTRYGWLSGVIDQARAVGIPWVVVGMHKNCLSIGAKSCEIGSDLMNLLINKRVDLVLQGHDHNYQRSKQLTCASIGIFVGSCVADDGSDNLYTKGGGTLFMIDGMAGRCCYPVNPSDSEAGYFSAWDGSSNGLVKYTVSPQRIDVQFVATTGSFSDSFVISDGSPAPPPPPPVSSLWKTVNYDPGFDTPELTPNQDVQTYEFWHPNTHGPPTNNAYISDATLHTSQNDNSSTSWGSFDNAVAHQGHFPWETDCGVAQKYILVWTCPRNSYGLLVPAHSEWPLNLSSSLAFLNRAQAPNSGEFNLIIGLYFYFVDGNLTSPGAKACSQSGNRGPYRWLEAQVRFATNIRGVEKPIGHVSCWDPGFDFGYSETIANVLPGQNYALSDFDVRAFYRRAMSYWGFSSDTHAILVGIEPGTEGFGVKVDVDWYDLALITQQPDIANADFDFNHTVDSADLSLVQSLVGQCPPVFYTTSPRYQWRVDVDSSNPCIDSADVSLVQGFLGTTYGYSPSPDFSITASPHLLSVDPGSNTTSVIRLVSLDNFSGTISLALSVPIGLTASLSVMNVTLSSGESGTSTLTVGSSTVGTHNVPVTGTSGSLSHSTNVILRVGNRPPVPDPLFDRTVDEGITLSFTETGTDPDGDPVSFSFGPSPPSGASVTSKGDFSWTPNEAQGPGSYVVTVVTTDGFGASASLAFKVTVSEVNLPPVLTIPGPQTVRNDARVAFQVAATDPDIPINTISLTVSGLPAGASFDGATGTFTWMPPSGVAGTYTVTFTATDTGIPSLSDSKAVAILVSSGRSEPCFICGLVLKTSVIWLLAFGLSLGAMSVIAAYYVKTRGEYRRLLRSRNP